jgi:hypothetical protein
MPAPSAERGRSAWKTWLSTMTPMDAETAYFTYFTYTFSTLPLNLNGALS